MAGTCSGENFCCWVPIVDDDGNSTSIPCIHSRDLGPQPEGTRRYVCSLRGELGSWEAVRASEDYQRFPGAVWDELGTEHCDVYPTVRCGACGQGVSVEVT